MISISEKNLTALVRDCIEETLTPERLDALAQREIDQRIGLLTMEQARVRLQCKNARQLADFCREQKIPLVHFGRKKRFLKIADIETAIAAATMEKNYDCHGDAVVQTKNETK